MNKLILYCKSYSGDVNRCKILLESVKRYNKDNIPFYISVSSDDVNLFKNTLGNDGYTLLTDEEILGDKLVQSWKNQQVVKMALWKTNITENYVVLDSDSYFIRDFYYKDFLVYDNVPYTVMHEQKDLFGWTAKNFPILGFDPQYSFAECRTPVMELFERPGRLYDFGPVPVIWSSKVWKALEEEYIKPNDLTFEKIINTISSEFTWYGEALLTWKPIELWPIEPIFKVFHYPPEYHEFKHLGYAEEHWAKNYLGVVMQSSSGLPLKY
jgi:Family of unknown function (DUF6492)